MCDESENTNAQLHSMTGQSKTCNDSQRNGSWSQSLSGLAALHAKEVQQLQADLQRCENQLDQQNNAHADVPPSSQVLQAS